MKKLKSILALLLVLTFSSAGCQYSIEDASPVITSQSATSNLNTQINESVEYASFFDKSKIHTIDINIDEDSLQAIYDAPLDETYYSASINLDGVILENVGFRTKGNMTLRSVANSESDRYSFKINTSKYVDGQKLDGLDEFVLNNMYTDASYLREYLSYELMASVGMNVPMASFINVSINGEAVGFYLLVESVDDSFLNRVFNENDGNLYRQDMGSDLKVDSTGEYVSSNQKNGNDETKSDLNELTRALAAIKDGDGAEIESILDVDSALYYIASNFMLSNYDSYSSAMQQNYYLYNHEGIFYVIPWDFNGSLGGFHEQATKPLNVDVPVISISMDQLPLIDKLLSVEAYKNRYYEILSDYMDELEDIESHITELSDWIRPYVEADPTKFVRMEDFEAGIIYQENEQINTVIRKPGDYNRPTAGVERPGGLPANEQGVIPPKRDDGMNNGSGRSIVNVIRESIFAVNEQVMN
jgi:hypothetical protein